MSDASAATPSIRSLLLLSIPAVAIGVGSAVVLRLLDVASDGLGHVLWEWLPAQLGATESTWWWIIIVLTVIGLLVGLVVQFAPGHAGPDTATTELDEPPPKLIALPSLVVVVVLGLGGGVSLGPENPIILINAALAVAIVARITTRIPAQTVMMLALSATIGALFGTPVAAALLFTGIVGAIRTGGSLWDRLFLPLAAAGAGAVTMLLLGGRAIAFGLEPMGPVQPIYLLTGVLIAAASAGLGILAAWLLPYVHRAFHALGHPVVFTTLGGLMLGILGAIGTPMTMFKGLDQTGELLTHPDAYSPGQLAMFVGIKLVALLVAASAGFRGGRIFPAVFIGTAFGLLATALIPGVPIVLGVACGVMGITVAATRDGWMGMFVGVALVGDVTVLPLLCIIILPVWLIVTKAPHLVVKRPAPEPGALP